MCSTALCRGISISVRACGGPALWRWFRCLSWKHGEAISTLLHSAPPLGYIHSGQYCSRRASLAFLLSQHLRLEPHGSLSTLHAAFTGVHTHFLSHSRGKSLPTRHSICQWCLNSTPPYYPTAFPACLLDCSVELTHNIPAE